MEQSRPNISKVSSFSGSFTPRKVTPRLFAKRGTPTTATADLTNELFQLGGQARLLAYFAFVLCSPC